VELATEVLAMLNTDSATPYLLMQGLINTASIIDGELTIVSAARRNRNLRVEGPAGAGYLIKQPDSSEQDCYQTLHCEADFYKFCQQRPETSAMAELLPRLVHFDAERAVLVLDLFPDATPLWKYYWSHTEQFPNDVSRAFGHALGTVHKILRSTIQAWEPGLPWSHRNAPWIMLVHKPEPESLARLSAANYQTLRILQAQGNLSMQLDGLRHLWQPNTVIHNDIRGDNILVLTAGSTQNVAKVEIRVVDWEMVQIGDPAWDLAAALQDIVHFWIASLPLAFDVTIEQAIAQARYPWAAMQGAIRALWQGYRDSANLVGSEASALLVRAVTFSGARLIQSAFEMSQGPALTAQAVLLLQISENLLNEPGIAQVQFYGIPLALGLNEHSPR
jgi:Ser/Thr protein kinase RdoA (MazF antagonist)